jgi:hypothetical protein
MARAALCTLGDMNARVTIPVALFAALSLLGCDDKKSDTSDEESAASSADTKKKKSSKAPVKAVELSESLGIDGPIEGDTAAAYKGLKVKAPAGCKAGSDADQTKAIIKCGERSYEIVPHGDDTESIADLKKAAKGSKMDKLGEMYIDKAGAIAWSWSFKGGAENHSFAADAKVGDKTFRCSNKGYGSFDRSYNEALLKSCQSLAE